MMAQDAYYKEYWHRVLLSLIRYKSPSVANADLYSLSTFVQDKNQPIFFHVDFMKPGKNVYVVEHNPVYVLEDVFMQMSAFRGADSLLTKMPEAN